MKKIGKLKNSKRVKPKAADVRVQRKRAEMRVTIGLSGFAKISAIEGLHMTREMKATFRELDDKGASARERRATIIKKYGTGS